MTTYTMDKALLIAAQNGGWVATGLNEDGRHGSIGTRISALTIGALVARGLATRCLSPDGGVAARLTEAGKALATKMGGS